jgi:aspartyl-tRNA(Asn)/glutamyl-tRNA(Gln) amidotransferase subunit B
MRSKEEAHDYRYFPEPDLPPVFVDEARVRRIRSAMPELPDEMRRRFTEAYGLPAYDAVQLTGSRSLSAYFEAAVGAGAPPKAVSNWMMGELARVLNERHADISDSPVSASALAELLLLIERGVISGPTAKAVFETMVDSGRAAEEIVRTEGLTQIDDESQILDLVQTVLEANGDAAAQYRAGKTTALGYLVGQVMKRTAGKANPRRVNDLLKRLLDHS